MDSSQSAKKQRVFTEYSIPKSVATMAIPATIGNVVMMLYNMADTYFVGQTGDANQVAAVALILPIFFVMMALGNMFGIGGASLISRSLGQGKHDKVKHISSFCFYGCIAGGILTTFLVQLLMPHILTFLGANEATTGHARDYLNIVSWGAICIVVQAAFLHLVRSEGAAKAAMVGQLLGTATNIILDPVFVLWFNMGIRGVAIATVIGNVLAFLFYIGYITFSKTALSLSPRMFKANEGIAREVFAIGSPMAITSVLTSASYLLYNKAMVAYGELAVAASAIATRSAMFAESLQTGIGMGIQPLIGYNYGAKNFQKMRKTIRFTIGVTICIGTIMFGLMMLFASQFVRAFLDNSEVQVIGTNFVRIFIVGAPVTGVLITLMASFQGMGKAIPTLVLNIGRVVLFVSAILVAQSAFGMYGVAWAQPTTVILTIILAIVMYYITLKKENLLKPTVDPTPVMED